MSRTSAKSCTDISVVTRIDVRADRSEPPYTATRSRHQGDDGGRSRALSARRISGCNGPGSRHAVRLARCGSFAPGTPVLSGVARPSPGRGGRQYQAVTGALAAPWGVQRAREGLGGVLRAEHERSELPPVRESRSCAHREGISTAMFAGRACAMLRLCHNAHGLSVMLHEQSMSGSTAILGRNPTCG